VDAEAYEAYLMGMRLATMDVSEESWVKATELFEHAIDRDPEFAPAYVGLSIVLRNTAHTYQAPSELMPRSYAAALAAVELDEDLSDAHACLGRAKCRWQWDWSGAESEFRRALELDPSNEYALRSYGEFRAVIGESEEAVQAYHRAFEVDPLNRSTMASVGWVYFFTRQHDKGIAHLSSTVKIYPEFINARLFLAWNYASAGQYENAALEIERCRGINAAVDSNPFTLITDMWVFSGLGDNERTTEVLNRFLEMSEETYVPPSFLAYGYVFLGDTDRAIAWMEKAYDSRDTHLAFARGLPLYDPIRSDPRFQDILRRMNFPED
jgi:serine/threonine-protein kinase